MATCDPGANDWVVVWVPHFEPPGMATQAYKVAVMPLAVPGWTCWVAGALLPLQFPPQPNPELYRTEPATGLAMTAPFWVQFTTRRSHPRRRLCRCPRRSCSRCRCWPRTPTAPRPQPGRRCAGEEDRQRQDARARSYLRIEFLRCRRDCISGLLTGTWHC